MRAFSFPAVKAGQMMVRGWADALQAPDGGFTVAHPSPDRPCTAGRWPTPRKTPSQPVPVRGKWPGSSKRPHSVLCKCYARALAGQVKPV